jgi:D-inositol-3-phosphate glycosyltransferase
MSSNRDSTVECPELTEESMPASGTTEAVATKNAPVLALLTGGSDRPYALGIASALAGNEISLDFIGSDELDAPELHDTPLIRFLNLRGDQTEQVSFRTKLIRILRYYARLIWYAAVSRPKIFHILWNNKFELIDRVGLMVYYRLLGKKIVLTAHNVNAAKRDGKDSLRNRLSLRFQYRMSDHIFVHTERMKGELLNEFGLDDQKVSVIPFGINNTIPTSEMSARDAKQALGVSADEPTVLFFGQIAPYKGLEYLVAAIADVLTRNNRVRLIIAGKIKRGSTSYWEQIREGILSTAITDRVIERIRFIPDDEVELYFKAADVAVLPYVTIFQSGVPFLAYSFGLPVLATDVGSLKEDVVEGKTGFVCKPCDSVDLARTIEKYFASTLYRDLAATRLKIQNHANETYSWAKVAKITSDVYDRLCGGTTR